MNEAQLRAELLDKFQQMDAIEKKYGDGLITNETDQELMGRLLGEVRGLETKVAEYEDTEARRRQIEAGLTKYGVAGGDGMPPPAGQGHDLEGMMDLGTAFVQSEEYQACLSKDIWKSPTAFPEFAVALEGVSLLELKTLVQAGTYGSRGDTAGNFIMPDRQPGYLELLQRERTLLQLIPRVRTDSDVIEYVKEKTFTNAATGVLEATATTGTTGTKPESTIEFEIATQNVEMIAHWIPVTNKLLRNVPSITGIINERLLLGLDLVLETQVLSGGGTAPDLAGLLNAGIQVQALGTDNIADCIHKALTAVRVTGLSNPNVIVMHPNDWQRVRLMRENAASGTLGGYLFGPPSQAGSQVMWGLPVVLSLALTEGTAIVGDFRYGCTLFDAMRAIIRTGLINDQFVRNMRTILAELAAAFVVWRPNSFCQCTGLNA